MRRPPLLAQQQQDRRDQRAGVADADPPDEVDDVEAPADRDVDAPDADARRRTGRRSRYSSSIISTNAMREADEPAARRPPGQHDRADLVGDRARRCARLDDRRGAAGSARGVGWIVGRPCVRSTPSRSSGFGLRNARQVRRARPGVQLGQQRRSCAARPSACDTRLFGSLRLPKTIASVGQACWQAVTTSPSRIAPVLASRRRSARALMRCTQYVHFSITPRLRTVTSGLSQQLQARRVVQSVVLEEVEAPHLVRAVVRAVPRADAAVVDHLVQALGAVRRSPPPGRPPRRARSRSACTAPAGSSVSGLSSSPCVVAVDAQPVHLAAAQHLVLADDRDVVLRLAGDDAGVAADAGVEVDRHAPLVARRTRDRRDRA